MSTFYLCKKCDFKSSNFNDIKRHINKKKICLKKNIESFNYSDDQLLILSLLPYYNDKQYINNIDIEYLKNSNILSNNKKDLLKIFEDIEYYKIKKCKFCNQEFQKIIDLRNHILINCFYQNYINKRDINEKNSKSIILDGNNNSNNNINNLNNCILNTTQNITNNNIFLEIKPPLPFDGEWDISKLDENIKARLLISKIMYSTLLEEILKNDNNLNVIIDKDSKSGIVYKNDKEQYISMKLMDIINESMEKLKNHLMEINEEESNTNEFESDIIRYSKSKILTKYNDYKNYEGIQSYVNETLSNIFDKNKEDAIEKSKTIKNINVNVDLIKDGF
jgi:hypothetical protein